MVDAEVRDLRMRMLGPSGLAITTIGIGAWAMGGGGWGGGWGGPGGGGRGGPNASPQERDQWRQGMLDNSTPSDRGQMRLFFQDMSNRRQQLGLPAGGGGGGRPR